eukprot:5117931-Prymnesium_polylepis.1
MAKVLRSNTILTSLNLSNNGLGDQSGKALAETLVRAVAQQMLALRSLDLSRNALQEEEGVLIVEMLGRSKTL